MIKTALSRSLLSVLSPAGAGGKLTILQFHRVPALIDPLSPTEMGLVQFERILDILGTRTTVLPLREAAVALAKGCLPSRAAAITFDDGYAEWIDVVSPVLRKRNMHATFFVTTEQLGGATMWHERINAAVKALPDLGAKLPAGFTSFADLSHTESRVRLALELQERFKYVSLAERNAAIRLLEMQAYTPLAAPPLFNEDSVRQLHNDGFEIGAHTVRHPILNEATDEQALAEIGGSKEQLESIIGGSVNLFAYPNGKPVRDFSARHIEMVKACGFVGAVITGGGAASAASDPFQLPRFTPWGMDETRITLQLARNMFTRPRLYSVHQPTRRKPTVMFVENGSGFGGAIVALQTLLSYLPTQSFDYHVVTNLNVGEFGQMRSVKSHHVIVDQVIDTRQIALKLKAAGDGAFIKFLLFLTGRLDDLVNRLPYLLRLLWLALKLRPDIIHGNNEPASNREAMLVARILGKGYVQHVRGPTSASRHTPWLLHMPRAFIPVSRWLEDELLQSGVANARIRQIYDAVEPADSHTVGTAGAIKTLRDELGLAQDVVLVAMVGMLLPWKGQDQFIEAVAQIPQNDLKVAYLVIGGTPARIDQGYAGNLRAQVSSLGLDDRVFFLGRRADLALLLPQINVVVSASKAPEPLGLVMLEAMTHGCIFVGPDHGAAQEVVVDGENGYLFEPCLPASMAHKLTCAIHATQQQHQMQLAAKLAVQDQFSGQCCANATSHLYQSLMFGMASHS